METQKNILRILLTFLIISILAFIVTLNWTGCKTEEIVNSDPSGINTINILDGYVFRANYMGDSIPLENVKVELINGAATYTDSSGYFYFENLNPNNYTIKYSKDGYTPNFIKSNEANFHNGIIMTFLSRINDYITIGPAGGIIRKDNKTMLIPPGALKTETQISLNSFTYTNGFYENYQSSDVIYIYPEAISFLKPVQISMPFEDYSINKDTITGKVDEMDEINYNYIETGNNAVLRNDSIIFTLASNSNDLTQIASRTRVRVRILRYWKLDCFGFNYSSSPDPLILLNTRTITTGIKNCNPPLSRVLIPPSSYRMNFESNIFQVASPDLGMVIRSKIYTPRFNQFPLIDVPNFKCLKYKREYYKEGYSYRICANLYEIRGNNAPVIIYQTFKDIRYAYYPIVQTPIFWDCCHDQGGN